MTKMYQFNDIVDEVYIGDAFSYCGDVHLCKDGSVIIPEIPSKRLFPGTVLYQTTSVYADGGAKYTLDRAVAIEKQTSLLDSGAGSGVLEQMIRVSANINRSVAKGGPKLKTLDDNYDSFFARPDWEKYRYAELTHPGEIRYAMEIDKIIDKHDPHVIKEYLINKWVDEHMRTEIGGFLHLVKNQPVTQLLIDAMYLYQSAGGRLGKTALEGIALFTGDDSDLKQSVAVYND